MPTFSFPVIAIVVIVLFWLVSCINILKEYERGVIFRLGRVLKEAKGPGLIFVFKPIDTIQRVALRVIVLDVPPQDIITSYGRAAIIFRVGPVEAHLPVKVLER